MTKSIDQIAEALAKGDVISANNHQYDMNDVRAVMDVRGIDMLDAAYEVAEKILRGEW